MQLTVDTRWYTRYRSRTKNPDFGDNVPARPFRLGSRPASSNSPYRMPTSNGTPDFTQAIANTAGFHFATIEQGGTSLYPKSGAERDQR